MTFTIRHATTADVAVLAPLHLHVALTAYGSIFPPEAPKPTVDEMASRWATTLADGIAWVGVADGQVIGMAGLVPTAPGGGRLEAVYVDPDWWGQGVGDSLLDFVEAEAAARGWLPLRLWVLEANDRARRWYERRGWEHDSGVRRTVWGEIGDVGYRWEQGATDRMEGRADG